MPKVLKARWAGKCCKCGRTFPIDTPITYSTQAGAGGKYFHAPNPDGSSGCVGAPDAVPAAPSYVAPSVPVPQPETIQVQVPVSTPVAQQIVRKLKKLSATSTWYDIFPHLLAAGVTRILLIGPPGTGKSRIASENGLWPRVTRNQDAGAESVLGTFIQKDHNTVWVDGSNVTAMRTATPVVHDEFDHSSPEVSALDYAFMDDNPEILLPTGERVQAQPGYTTIATSNASPQGMNEAIFDRFEVVLFCGTPTPAAVQALRDEAVKNPRFANDASGAIAWADKVVGAMQGYYRNIPTREWDWVGRETYRTTRNFTKLVNYGFPEELAAKLTMGTYGREYLNILTTAAATVGA